VHGTRSFKHAWLTLGIIICPVLDVELLPQEISGTQYKDLPGNA